MKAVCCSKYGSPDFLVIRDVAKPAIRNNELLVKVHAVSINSYDYRIMSGKPFLVRMNAGLFSPGKRILGVDFAGTVEAIGDAVSKFTVGDRVYGCLADGSGDSAWAEYVRVKESVAAAIPSETTFVQAAALPMAAVTALQGLRDVGGIQPGSKVLVNGASGGVGTFAVQIAKAMGAEVTGVCSAKNMEMVRSIGADAVINYDTENFAKNDKQYDLILDVAANHTLEDYHHVLKSNGTCAVVGFSGMGLVAKILLFGSRTAKKDGKRIRMVMANNTRGQDLEFLNTMLESGKVKPVIDGCYPLADVKTALSYFEKEHAKGKVAVEIIESTRCSPTSH